MSEADTYLSLWRGSVPKPPPPAPVTYQRAIAQSLLDYVVKEVAGRTGIPADVIIGRSRKKKVNHARQAVMHRLRSITNAADRPIYSWPEIGRALDRDHSTVISGFRAHQARLDAAEKARAA